MSNQPPGGWAPPPPTSPPAPRRRHTIRNIALVIVGLLVAGGIISTLSDGTTSTNVPAANDQTAGAPTATTSKAAKGSKAGVVLLRLTGSGTKTTRKFTAAGDWDLAWSYDCSSFGYDGNFQVFPTSSDPLATLNLVNQLGRKDSGVEHYHEGGTIYLEVNSECDWTIRAVAA